MTSVSTALKNIVAAFGLTALFALPVFAEAQTAKLADLLDRLERADPVDAKTLDRQIKMEWDKSGSAAMNLLLQRGRDAAERGDLQLAVDHFTALTDHAPDFAEGWHERASAWFRMGRPGLALADLETALHLNPNHYEALFGMAVILEQLNQPELAYRAYALVQDMHPHYVEAQEALARLQILVQGREL